MIKSTMHLQFFNLSSSSAGSVITGKGVSLIKEIKLTAVREAVKETSEGIKLRRKRKSKPHRSRSGDIRSEFKRDYKKGREESVLKVFGKLSLC